MEQQLENNVALYSAVLNSIAHELRTPLTSITAVIETLSDNEMKYSAEAHQELLQIALSEAHRLNRVIDNLLMQARLDAGIIQPKKECQGLPETVARAISYFRAATPPHKFTLEVQPNLPLLEFDEALLERAVISLLQYTLKRTPKGTIGLHLYDTLEEVIFEITDRGTSLPTGTEQLLFSDFYWVTHGTSDELGIPLLLARRIVELHDGRIWAENRSKGSVAFCFALLKSPKVLAFDTFYE